MESLSKQKKEEEVILSEHNELPDEEIIEEIEKYFKIMEERDKTSKETYDINFLEIPFNNQEPYQWQLESLKLIEKPPNEEEETESNYIYLSYITFEDIYGDESQ
ncbi:hypothetical protein O181_053220 [Austropuccinia psidii MF-1]|uniref:Uncharacterized protein n=1 Tax=Austropuccinia psidii MF-1 TaxID=1389203 RepID=A0A9Q3HTC1_9BASI|nr:hypothetical protein [Austropuccinia psidii MF-1]